MVDGRAAIHEACREGFISVLKALLEYNPDLDIMVCMIIPLLQKVLQCNAICTQNGNGLKPIHVCAYRYVAMHSFYVCEAIMLVMCVQQLCKSTEDTTGQWCGCEY